MVMLGLGVGNKLICLPHLVTFGWGSSYNKIRNNKDYTGHV